MKCVRVNAGKGYDILIEKGLLDGAGNYIADVSRAKKICIVSDSNVFPIYGDRLQQSLQMAGAQLYKYIYPAGEQSKTTATVIALVEYLAENAFTRNDLIVALGGGVCGDMAGFAAAIYLRGIDFVQIPTSLLAQVDSSVGGKTAVDLPQGKNLCGAFHQPVLVLIDPDTLETLPPRYYADGLAEAVKMGCIKSAPLFELLENGDAKAEIETVITQCVSLKAQVVERDEKEHGERALLNFGHTAGHAIEKLHGFTTVSHGEAVGIGMILICEAAEKHGLTAPGTANRIAAVLKKYHLPTADIHTLDEIIPAMRADKKRTGSSVKFIMIKEIGEGYIHPIAYGDIPPFFGVV